MKLFGAIAAAEDAGEIHSAYNKTLCRNRLQLQRNDATFLIEAKMMSADRYADEITQCKEVPLKPSGDKGTSECELIES